MFRKYSHLYFDEAATNTDGAAENSNTENNVADGSSKTDNKTDNKSDDKKYSDADLDRIISKKFEKWQKQQQAAVDEATKLAKMNAQEKAEHERDTLKAELEALKKANTVSEMEKIARKSLSDDSVNVPDEIIARLVDSDAETTSANVKAFSKAFKKAVQDEVKAQLGHKSPKAGASGNKNVTLDDINKETDMLKRQQMIRDNMHLFKKGR